MKIVLAPDSFKGNLTSLQVATALERGIKRVISEAKCIKIPMADGGEGTVHSIVYATGGKFARKKVTGPTGKAITARYGFLPDTNTAIIEMAAASGLPYVENSSTDKNPMKTTSYGTGELIMAAVKRGYRRIILGLGGSATVDGGVGIAQALGVKFFKKNGRQINSLGSGGMLDKIAHIDMSELAIDPKKIEIIAICDVQNTLYGKQGAANIFGRQKGATQAMIRKLNTNLINLARVIKKDLGKDIRYIPSGGAAGGAGAGIIAFTNGKLQSGIDFVVKICDLEKSIRGADLVVTGEGRIDSQTAFGKTPAGVAFVASKLGVPTVAIGGAISDDARTIFQHKIDGLASACARDMSLQEAMQHSSTHLANAMERVMRLILIGKRIQDKLL